MFLCPNVYSMSQKGSYDSSLNPVDAAIKKFILTAMVSTGEI